MLGISCHADTNFREHRLQMISEDECLGHLDNFVGVHAVMNSYFSGKLPKSGVRIELTYGEETDFAGAYAVRETLCASDVVIVVDVTGTNTDKDLVFEKCADPKLRLLIERSLAGMSYDLYADCPDPVCQEDETDVYQDVCPMSCFLGIPVTGGDYNAGVVRCRKRSIEATAEAICRIANEWSISETRCP